VTYETLSIAAGAAIEGRLTRKDAVPTPIVQATPEPAPARAAPEKIKAAKPPKTAPKMDEPGLLVAAAAPASAAAG
ncbi:MAG TPA: hypothetical protein VEZ41_15480, partial [Allosphingosinicella sp.]|nr:hypothetical protein [Allosphingosinicella sp.]